MCLLSKVGIGSLYALFTGGIKLSNPSGFDVYVCVYGCVKEKEEGREHFTGPADT